MCLFEVEGQGLVEQMPLHATGQGFHRNITVNGVKVNRVKNVH